ncbi:7TM diverse intracellular signaling domain-containing protein [Pedobacter sp. BMA]|uniref:7TM diverse intracellular signaling domain-containing protein n=1 Tax=Pedobacter sp. BMA TaxID=1663685 RepID=UPI00069CC9F5|nr:7TM diverse intracellular signaling domain-containing protein [Pedobacter sp. BMA]
MQDTFQFIYGKAGIIRSLKSLKLITIGLCATILLFAGKIRAQVPLKIDDNTPHQLFTYNQIDILEDPTGKLGIGEIITSVYQHQFKPNKNRIPKNEHQASAYWYRFKICHNEASQKKWILEFFDQSITDLKLYVSDGFTSYQENSFGTRYDFANRVYEHKNFTYDLNNNSNKLLTYYVRIKCDNPVSAIFVVRDFRWFLGYAISEYFIFGLFYGMIFVFCLYNLLMYFAIKGKQYLYYVLYNLGIGLYEMCNDGIAFQYLWPSFPALNTYGFGVSLFISSIFGMLFTIRFLYLKAKSPLFHKIVLCTIFLRTVFFLACLISPTLFNFKIIEIIPLIVVFSSAMSVYRMGFKPALFLVSGYGILLSGFAVKILLLLKWIPYGTLAYYSLSICFVIEMVLVSFAIGNSIRSLRKKKNFAQKRIIEQLQVNDKLNQTLNNELTAMVESRTRELREKAEIIEAQNVEISVMNAMLKQDVKELNLNIERVTKARVMAKKVDFEEFSRIYPDKESCFKYLSELKWSAGYACKKCGNDHYLNGATPHARRCTRCGYDESVIAGTLFQNSRIPINKALYMLLLVYNSKGTISSYKLSQILEIRQGTCWTYNSKMQKIYQEKKDIVKKAGEEGWTKLIME